MNYRLHRDGQSLGSFSLSELRQQRALGRFTGTEFVWCEGMPDWEQLDVLLQREAGAGRMAAPPPLPIPARSRGLHPGIIVAIVVAVCLLGAVFVVGLIGVVRAGRLVASAGNISSSRNDAYTAATKPVVWTANTLNEQQVFKREAVFFQRQWIDGYIQRGDHTQACDADALKLLRAWQAPGTGTNMGGGADEPARRSDLLAEDATCTDPLVLAATGINATGHLPRVDRLQRAIEGFKASKHRAFPQFQTTTELAGEVAGPLSKIQTLDEQALALFGKSFSDDSIQPGDQNVIAEVLVNGWGRDFYNRNQAAVYRSVENCGPNYRWLELVLEGEYHITEAWKARGNGYANSVTGQGWTGFSAQLSEARRCLNEAWTMHPEYPIAPALMETVALGNSDITEMREWFDRAVTDQIDYPKAWSELRWGLRPRWYGDVRSMLAFGFTAVNTGRFDSDAPREFFDVVGDLEAEQGLPVGFHIYGRGDIWPGIQKLYEGYITNLPGGESADWRTSYCVVASIAHKYDTARAQLEAINWQPSRSCLNNWKNDFSLLPEEIAARTGTARVRVEQAEAARDRLDFGNAGKIYQALLDDTGADDRTRAFARARAASLTTAQKLSQGEWGEFLPQSDDDPNWVYAWGGHKATAGLLEADTAKYGHFFYSRVRVGADFEVRGEFEVIHTSGRDFQAGLIMGIPDCDSNQLTANWYAFRMRRLEPEGDIVTFSRSWSLANQVVVPQQLNDTTNTFEFILHGDTCSASVNDQVIFSSTRLGHAIEVPTHEIMLGVGAYDDLDQTVIRYHRMQVRTLAPQ